MSDAPPDDLARRAQAMWDCPDDMLGWVEPLAYKALESRVASAVALHAQATTTLTALIAGLAAAAGWALSVLKPVADPAAWGAAAAAAYLAVLVWATIRWCINVEAAPAIYNSPGNLLLPSATLRQVRVGELANIDARIEEQSRITARRAKALNTIRLAAIGVVPTFAIGAAVARFWPA